MQTAVDRVVLLQQVSDYAVQQLLSQMQERLEHLENTLAAMVAAGAVVVGDPLGRLAPAASVDAGAAEGVSMETELAPVLGNARLAAVLARAGYTSPEAVAAAPDEALLAIDGVSEKALKQIREKVAA